MDATGKKLGRLASEIAHIILGKASTDFAKNKVASVAVIVENASKMSISEKKHSEKEYDRYSGFPGGRKVLTLAQIVEQKGYSEILRKAVYNMIPANRLRKERMKNLVISE